MRLRHIELFQAIVRTGSLTRAAQALHITQPAASKLLGHAEASLGFSLFERVKGRLQLTHEAQVLMPAVDKLYHDLDDVRRLSQSLRGHMAGTLRVGCIPTLGLKVLPRTLAESQRDDHDVKLELITAHSGQLADALLAREIAIAFMFDAVPRPGLKVMNLHETELVCVDGSGDPSPVTLQGLDASRVIGLPAADTLGERVRPWLGSPHSGVQVQTYYVACAMAQAGAGIALIDAYTADALLRPGECARPLRPRLALKLTAVVREDAALSRLERAFIDRVGALAAQVPTP